MALVKDDRLARARAALFGSTSVVVRAREDPEARRLLEQAVAGAVARSADLARPEEVAELAEELLGFGPLQPLLADPRVTDVLVNRPDEVYVERDGRLVRTGARFRDERHVEEVARRLAAACGRRLDAAHPFVDARLPDGSRLHAVLPPCAPRGAAITIRRFGRSFPRFDELERAGTLAPEVAGRLRAAVAERRNVLVAGATGSGKTTLVNALAGLVSPDERIITIEDALELRIDHPHVVPLECRHANVEGVGAVTLRDLVRQALRMRPDRIVIGEMRGPEAFDVLQAWHTGHRGSFTTIHANGPEDALERFATLAALGGGGVPFEALARQVRAAADLVVFLSRDREGRRRVTAIEAREGAGGR
ncbi:MAG: CpaF family protein [Clostridia bacterium]|nr:CpaF family protein [Clostridia bacterium]